MKALKRTLIILVIILLALISFGGIFIQKTRFVENILPEFKLGAELSGTRNIGLVVSTATDTIIYDKDGNEVELKQDLDDGSGIQPIDEQAFTTVNDFEGQEGFGVENAEGEQEAGQSDGFDDLFADGESESDDDYGFGFGDDSSDDE